MTSGEIYDPSTSSWSTLDDSMATGRHHHTATLLSSGKVLVSGGSDISGNVFFSSCELYDPVSDSWSVTDSLDTARYIHTSTLLPSGKLLVMGGYNSAGAQSGTELYDPVLETWTTLAPMLMKRFFHTSTLLPSGEVLAIGGAGDGGGSQADCELYNPNAGAWSTSGTLVAGRLWHAATPLTTGKILIAGGLGNTNLASCELFDPTTGTWTGTGGMTTDARSFTSLTLLPSGNVLMAGGYNGPDLSSCERYNPTLGTWSATAAMATARSFHSATLLPTGKVLVAGGFSNGTNLTSCELYDPVSGTWSATGSMAVPKFHHTATLLPSGLVLVAGGYRSGGYSANCELYNPATGTWSATGAMGATRYRHTSVLLPSGKVLVAGGFSLPGVVLPSCELYDPTFGTWSDTDPMAEARISHCMSLLPSGMVMVMGGTNQSGGFELDVELYEPSRGQWSTTASLSTARTDFTATVLPSGKILIAAGQGTTSGVRSSSEIYDPGLGYSLSDRPIIISLPTTLTVGSPLALSGTLFTGHSEGSSGGNNSSPTNFPLVQIQSVGNGRQIWVPYDPAILSSATSVTVGPLTELPPGPAWVRVFANAVPSEAKSIKIRGATTITWLPLTAIIYGTALSPVQLNATSLTAGTFTYSPAIGTILDAGSHVVTATFTPSDVDTYAPSSRTANLQVNPKALTVTATSASRAYGATNPAFTGVITGMVAGDAITATYASSASTNTPSGTYGPATAQAITPTVADPGNRLANYLLTTTKGTLTITKASLLISATDQSILFGQALPTLTATATGLVSPDTLASLDTPPTLTTTATTLSRPGSYPITVGGAIDNDYTITYAQGSLTIDQAQLTLTAANKSIIIGEPIPVLTMIASGLVGSDTLDTLDTPPTLTTTATELSTPGIYPIIVSGTADADYDITHINGTLTIRSPSNNTCGFGTGFSTMAGILLLALWGLLAHRRKDDVV